MLVQFKWVSIVTLIKGKPEKTGSYGLVYWKPEDQSKAITIYNNAKL